MDENEIINLFRLTMNPEYTKEAESKLAAVKYCQNFPQVLIKIVECDSVEESVRHCAVIMLKNLIREKWSIEEGEEYMEMQRDVNRFTQENDLHLTDKQFIEHSIVSVTLKCTTNLIKDQLILCINIIMKRSYPKYFAELPAQMVGLVVSSGEDVLITGLEIILNLLKSQELKNNERTDMICAQMLPLAGFINKIFVQYSPLDTQEACLVQTLSFKILNLLNSKNRLIRFLGEDNLRSVLDCSLRLFVRPPPANVPADDGAPSPWSKSRKWSIRIFCEIFKRTKDNKDINTWFIFRYAEDVIKCVFSVFGQITHNMTVSDYVLQYAVIFLRYCIVKISTWKLMVNHVIDIIRHIFMRLLAYNNKLIEQFQSDPQRFVEDYCLDDYLLYPDSAIRDFLNYVAKCRSNMLPLIVNMCMHILTEDNDSQKYAVFSVLGYISRSLVKNETYKNDMENLFVVHIFPATKSTNPLIRYKSYWLLETLVKVPFRDKNNEMFIAERITSGILNESSFPVQYQAIFLLERFLSCGTPDVLNSFIPYIKQFTMNILSVIKTVSCHRSSYVLEKMFDIFSDNIGPIAYDIIQNSVQLVLSLLHSDSNLNDNLSVISGLIGAVDTIVDSISDNTAVSIQIDPLIEQIISLCFSDELIIDMWDDFCMLLCTVTEKRVPPTYWKYLYRFIDVFPSNLGLYPFEAMVDWLHNFITVDTANFLSNPEHFNKVMSAVELAMSCGDVSYQNGSECLLIGLKLYEIIMISCKGSLNVQQLGIILKCVYKMHSSEGMEPIFKESCLMTFVSALYCDYPKAVGICSSVTSSQGLLIDEIMLNWISFISTSKIGRHNLKLSLLVVVEMLTYNENISRKYLPALMPISLSLCNALQKEYQKPTKSDDENDYSESDYSDESSIGSVEYEDNESSTPVGDNDEDDTFEESDDEEYNYDDVYLTMIDDKKYDMVELILFNDHLKALQERDCQYFYSLISTLNSVQQQQLNAFSDHISKVKLEKQSAPH